MNFNEHVRYAIEYEIIPRLREILFRRAVFIKTKSIAKAFPRASYFINRSNLKNESIESIKYINFLINNAGSLDAGSITRREANEIIDAVLRNANIEFLHYFNDRQFLQQIKGNLQKARRQSDSGKTPKSFEQLCKERYMIPMGGAEIFFFNLVDPKKKKAFENIVNVFCNARMNFIADLAPLRRQFYENCTKGITK